MFVSVEKNSVYFLKILQKRILPGICNCWHPQTEENHLQKIVEYLTHLYEEWSIEEESIHFSSVPAGKKMNFQIDTLT